MFTRDIVIFNRTIGRRGNCYTLDCIPVTDEIVLNGVILRNSSNYSTRAGVINIIVRKKTIIGPKRINGILINIIKIVIINNSRIAIF